MHQSLLYMFGPVRIRLNSNDVGDDCDGGDNGDGDGDGDSDLYYTILAKNA